MREASKLIGPIMVATLLLTMASARADDPDRTIASFGTYAELKAQCNSDDAAQRSYCGGVVAGTLGALTMLKKGLICTPTDRQLTLREITDAAFVLLNKAPNFGQLSATQGLTLGLGMAYPCPKTE